MYQVKKSFGTDDVNILNNMWKWKTVKKKTYFTSLCFSTVCSIPAFYLKVEKRIVKTKNITTFLSPKMLVYKCTCSLQTIKWGIIGSKVASIIYYLTKFTAQELQPTCEIKSTGQECKNEPQLTPKYWGNENVKRIIYFQHRALIILLFKVMLNSNFLALGAVH